ncbi:hypothetical protein BUALT_Bualt15G0005800 [Buddleja alternifolia]|uniref:Major facilitator superfamily (MFS) profile domain-containing protein n=1 Tax=Buddleja alternifolia TaxID=168488 RepID=A0AAV6WKN9_9LAMI|nr:hypothetical protein BUALT_Bualt15G0005800 [Buddleja alternifolia]
MPPSSATVPPLSGDDVTSFDDISTTKSVASISHSMSHVSSPPSTDDYSSSPEAAALQPPLADSSTARGGPTSYSDQFRSYLRQKLQLFTSSLYLAALFASLGASWVTKKLGHRIIMVTVGFMITLGSILTCAAVNIAKLIGGRFLIGIGIGFAYQTMPMHLSEMTPSKHHRFLNVLDGI